MCKSAPTKPRTDFTPPSCTCHSSQNRGVFCFIAPHSSPLSHSATPTQFVNLHNRLSLIVSAMRCVSGFWEEQSMAPYLNLHEWKWRHLSTQSGLDSLSFQCVCLSRLCGALLYPSVSITVWSRCEASSLTNTVPGHLRQPVLRHIFSLYPLMSLPAWVKACPNEPRDVEGCSDSR